MRSFFLQKRIHDPKRFKPGVICLHGFFVDHYTKPFGEFLNIYDLPRRLAAVGQYCKKRKVMYVKAATALIYWIETGKSVCFDLDISRGSFFSDAS